MSPNKLTSLVADMAHHCQRYPHDIRAKHVAVIISQNRPISKYQYNHLQVTEGTVHAEMAALQALYQRCCQSLGSSYWPWHCFLSWLEKAAQSRVL